MNDFELTVELDSPLLLSGARSGMVDPARLIRPASVRGLVHTFARALFGPLLASNPENTRHAERKLLGAQGGVKDSQHHEYGATFRIEVVPSRLGNPIRVLNCPHDQRKGKREGFPEDRTAELIVRPRPHAAAADVNFSAMLWTVLWTGFAFGALGNRSRRGYGSLTLTDIRGIDGGATPDLGALLKNAGGNVQQKLPVWQQVPADRAALAKDLCSGLRAAQAAAAAWLGTTGPPTAPTGAPSFFQLFGPDWVSIGMAFESSAAAMSTLMSACSGALRSNSSLYRRTMGAGGRDRLASPLWVRLYRTGQGWVPVATFSGDPENRALVDQVLTAIGAINGGTYQTLPVVAGRGGC